MIAGVGQAVGGAHRGRRRRAEPSSRKELHCRAPRRGKELGIWRRKGEPVSGLVNEGEKTQLEVARRPHGTSLGAQCLPRTACGPC